MPDLSKINVNDVDYDIKDAIARGHIGNMADLGTSEKSSLVAAANELLSRIAALSGITYIESTDTNNLVSIRELESGTYVFYGKFKPFTGSTDTLTFSSKLLVNVVKQSSASHVMVFYPVNNCVQYLKVTDDAYERKNINLNDLLTDVEDLGTNKLDADKLPAAVNEALAQAKASGEFDGKNGTSALASVSKSGDVTTITTQDATGTKTAEVHDGKDGKSGVYILSDGETINDVPDDVNVVIDPNGDENYATDVGAPIYSMDSNNPALSGVATTQKVPLHIYGFIRSDGTISTVENAMRTDYVAITSRMSSIYAKVNMSSGGYALAFFDGDKNLLPDISVLGTAELPQIVNVSLNEAYDNAKFFVVGYYDANKEYIHYDCTINYSANASGTDDYGLNILVFGDSISTSANISVDENDCTTQYTLKTNSYQNASGQSIVFNTWPNLLPNVLGCKDIRNYAYSGASYKDQERANGLEFQNLSYQIQVALNDVSNPNNVFPSVNYSPDIVIFALGTNDGSPNDTPESALSKIVLSEDGYSIDVDSTIASLNKGNFCESAMWAFLTVKKAFPMALGFCVLPIQRANSEANTQELHGYLSKMARRYGFIVIDGAYETGIVRDLEVCDGLGTMLKDGLHPNEKGQNLLCRAILTAIRRYYLPFAGMN